MSLELSVSNRSKCIPWSNYQHTMQTAKVARKARAKVIVHKKNKVKGNALKTGFETAVMLGADTIITMDSNGQRNSAEISELVAPIAEGKAEMVNGSRYLNNLGKDTHVYCSIGQTILDKFTKISSGLKIMDSQSGFRVFATSTIESFCLNAQNMAIESQMVADAGNVGLQKKEVGIDIRYEVDGSTKKPIYHYLEVLLTILKDMILKKMFYLKFFGMNLGGYIFEDCIFYKYTCTRSLI